MTNRLRRRTAATVAVMTAIVASATLLAPPAVSGATAHSARRAGSAGCAKTPVAPGVSDRTMVSAGVTRRFRLIVPPGYTGRRPLPLVLGLHPLTVDYRFVPGMIGFADMEERYEFIGVAPSGLLDGATPYWLAAPTAGNYDVAFVNDLLDTLESALCVDTRRVYSTGMSNGAQMSSLLACRLPKRITAVAPVAGVEFSDVCHGRPVPVIAFHGTADPIVLYNGGGLNARTIGDIHFWKGNVPSDVPVHHGVDAAMQTWAAHNGCDPTPVEVRISDEVRRRRWRHCRADTVLYIVDGGGHSWPGKPVPGFEDQFGHTTTDIDATTLIFRFFRKQHIPQRHRHVASGP